MDHKSHSCHLPDSGRGSRSGRGIIRLIRKPLIAYIVIMSIVGAAFGVNQSYVNHQLKTNDYAGCMRAFRLSQEANRRLANLNQPPLIFTENCRKLKP